MLSLRSKLQYRNLIAGLVVGPHVSVLSKRFASPPGQYQLWVHSSCVAPSIFRKSFKYRFLNRCLVLRMVEFFRIVPETYRIVVADFGVRISESHIWNWFSGSILTTEKVIVTNHWSCLMHKYIFLTKWHTHTKIFSSSSSYRAGSTDIPDPLSPLLPIVHRPR